MGESVVGVVGTRTTVVQVEGYEEGREVGVWDTESANGSIVNLRTKNQEGAEHTHLCVAAIHSPKRIYRSGNSGSRSNTAYSSSRCRSM